MGFSLLLCIRMRLRLRLRPLLAGWWRWARGDLSLLGNRGRQLRGEELGRVAVVLLWVGETVRLDGVLEGDGQCCSLAREFLLSNSHAMETWCFVYHR